MNGGEILAREWEGAPVDHWRRRWGVPALHLYRRAGSTNDIARRLAEAGAPAGTVVLADEQTAGRGRGGRRWYAPPGAALLLSIVLRPRLPAGGEAAPGAIPLRVGLAVARAVERVAGVRTVIKWPNDLLIEGRGKLAGILCEGAITASGKTHVVAGIGINVGQSAGDFPPEVRPLATSLRLVAGEISRPELAGAIISHVLALTRRAGEPLEPELLEELAERDLLRGRRVAIDGEPRGIACGIAAEGALLVREAEGRVARVYTGTVRAADGQTLAPGDVYP